MKKVKLFQYVFDYDGNVCYKVIRQIKGEGENMKYTFNEEDLGLD